MLPERIENELHPFASRELRSRNEICVAGNENDDLGLALQRDGCDIQADSHVHALLAQRRGKVSIRDIIERHFTAQKAPLSIACLSTAVCPFWSYGRAS